MTPASPPDSQDDLRPTEAAGPAAPPAPLRRPFAVWLLPDPASARRWQGVIDQLADRYDAPAFDAHVTVHVGSLPGWVDPLPALRDAASRAMPMILEAAANQESPTYFKTLYAPLPGPNSAVAALESLRETLVDAWCSAEARQGGLDIEQATQAALGGYRLEPHLSLLYAALDEDERKSLARAHDATGSLLRFDRLVLVTPRPGSNDLATVDKWELSEDCRLGATSYGGGGYRR